MKHMILYLKPFFPRMGAGLLIKFTGTVMDLLLPWIFAYMIDDIVPAENIPLVLIWGGIMLLCALAGWILNIIANRMAARVARDSVREMRQDLFEKALSLSGSQLDTVTIPSLESRLTSDTYNVYHMVGIMQRLGVRAPILLLGGIIVTLTLEPVLALVMIAVLPFITLVMWYVSRKGLPLYAGLQKSVDNMVRVARDNITGIRVIKALSKSQYEKERFDTANINVAECEKKAGLTMAFSNPVMNLLLNIGLTLVVVVGALRVDAGVTQPGRIIAFLSYFTLILNAMLSITRLFVMYSKAEASAERIFGVLNLPQDLPVYAESDESNSAAQQKNEEAHIVFEHVCFSYHKKADNLYDVSFRVKRGQTLGIIGATGSGKSTLIDLLMRMYDIDSGEIRIGGRLVKSIPDDELHTMFGVVFQNDILFADTIAGNIDYGRGLSMEQIKNAAVMAQAIFIEELPDGLEHQLTARGTNLSGGQKQRLVIARALAANPEILILDDASSALDYRTDAMLRETLRGEFAGVTTIVIAQRISSVMYADHILVLDGGRVLGYGSHGQLLESCELYREIHRLQMGGDVHA